MEIAYDDKTGKWKEYKPYASVDFMSEEDYQTFEELWKNRNLHRWIPIEESRPNVAEEVICCDADGVIAMGYVEKYGDSYKCVKRPYVMPNVIAWMPLPEPYQP